MLPRLHGVRAIPLTDPGDGIAGWKSTKDGQAGQGRSGSPMASKATQLNSVAAPSAFQQRPQGGHHGRRVTGHAEIGPVEVIVGPRRIPLRVEIETKLGNLVAGVGISGVKRNRGDLGLIRQHDDGSDVSHPFILSSVDFATISPPFGCPFRPALGQNRQLTYEFRSVEPVSRRVLRLLSTAGQPSEVP